MHVPCSDPIPPILSPTPPDPSLTPDNILQVTRNIPLWKSDYSYDYLDMSRSQHEEISRMYDGEKAKYEVVSAWLAGHPCPSWDHVKYLLWWLEDDGRGRKGAEDEVNEKYLTSELQYTTCSFHLEKSSVVLNSLQTCVTHCTCMYIHVYIYMYMYKYVYSVF